MNASGSNDQQYAMLRFAALSGVSFGLNTGITAAAHEWFGLAPNVAFLIALVIVFFVNFVAMRYFVYGRAEGSFKAQFAGFLASSIGFRAVEYGAFVLLHDHLQWHYLVVVVMVLVLSFVAKFFFYKTTVFRRRQTV